MKIDKPEKPNELAYSIVIRWSGNYSARFSDPIVIKEKEKPMLVKGQFDLARGENGHYMFGDYAVIIELRDQTDDVIEEYVILESEKK